MIEYRKYDVDFNGKKDSWYYGICAESINRNLCQIVVLDSRNLINRGESLKKTLW